MISHSRGTDVLGSALRELSIHYRAQGLDPAAELKLGHAIFLAADIDMDVANQRLGGERAWEAAELLTIYSGSGDEALRIAKRMFKSESRLGQAGPESMRDYQRHTLRHFEDRFHFVHRPRKAGGLGHAYYLDDPSVSSDLILLLRDNLRPGAVNGRPLLHHPTGVWIMPDGYPMVSAPEADASSGRGP